MLWNACPPKNLMQDITLQHCASVTNHALLLSARAKHWDEIASASEGRVFSFNFVYADTHLSGRKSSSAATNGFFYGFALSGRASSLVSLATNFLDPANTAPQKRHENGTTGRDNDLGHTS